MRAIIAVAVVAALVPPACARELAPFVALARDSGRFTSSLLKPWFDQLKSRKGLCCSFADGVTIEDVDWDAHDGQYRVWLDGQWLAVTEPNRYGRAVVWPYQDASGATQIRCFMPGAGT